MPNSTIRKTRTLPTAHPVGEHQNKLHELYIALDNAFSYQDTALSLAYELLGETSDPFFDELIVTLENNNNSMVLMSLHNDVENKIKGGE